MHVCLDKIIDVLQFSNPTIQLNAQNPRLLVDVLALVKGHQGREGSTSPGVFGLGFRMVTGVFVLLKSMFWGGHS